MRAIAASLLFALAAPAHAEPVDVPRMIEAIAQVEGGRWGNYGGICCISRIAWEQHRPHWDYDYSKIRRYTLPIYREHIEWLAKNLALNQQPVTPATIYVCWRRGLDAGVKILRRGEMPSAGTRCQNLYEALAR